MTDNKIPQESLENNEVVNKQQNETTGSNVKPKRKKTQIFRRALCAVGALFGLTFGATVAIIATETGSKWAIQVTEKMVDGLSIENVSGKLQNGLVLENLTFESSGVDVQIAQARLQVDFNRLWQGEIKVQDVSVKQPNIVIDTALLPATEADPETESSPMQRIHLPIGVAIDNVSMSDLNLQIDHNQIQLKQFQSAVSLNNESGLTLAPTHINGMNFFSSRSAVDYLQSQKNQEKQDSEATKNAKPIDWSEIEKTLTPAFLGNLNDITLPFDMHIADLQASDWVYRSEITARDAISDKSVELPQDQNITMSQLQIQADVEGYEAKLKTLSLQSSLGRIQGEGVAKLNGEMSLDLHIHSDIEALKSGANVLLPKSQADLTLSGSLKNVTQLELKTTGGINANVSAQVELNKDKMPLKFNLKTSAVQYPFTSNDPIKVKNLNLDLSGDLLDYQIELSGEASGMGIPNSSLALSASGKLYQADIKKLQLNALDGYAHLEGDVRWNDGVIWQSDIDLNKVNLGAFVKTFPAVLSGKLSTNGSAKSDTWVVNMPELDIQGSVNKSPLSLKGNINASQEQLLNVPNLQLIYGNNKIVAQGTLGEKSNFNLDINAPNLKGLVPDLTASLTGKVALTGEVSTPNLDLDLKGGNIQFQDLHLAKFAAKGKVNAHPMVQGDLNISLNGFKYGNDIQLHNATLTLTGDEKKHLLKLRSQGEPVAASLDLSGNFDRTSQLWKGVISQTNIKSPIGDIKNNQFNVSYDNKTVNANISAHCWSNTNIELCFPKAFNAGKNGEIPFDLKKLDLALVGKLSSNDILQGRLTSQGKFAWFEDKPIVFEAKINGNNINLAQKVDYRTFRLAIPKLSVNADIANNNLNVKSDISLQNQGNISADLKLQDLVQARKLGGTLKISGVNLNLANQLLSTGEKVSGDVIANLSFGGSLNAPLLNGEFCINKINTLINTMPFVVNNGELALRFHGTSSTLTGNIVTPESSLALDGDASWKTLNDWKTRIHAKSKEFFLNIPSMAKLKVTQDVEMRANPTALNLTGTIDIPWGRIAVESLPESAVSTSSDEVILDEKTDRRETLLKAAATKDGIAIKSDLRINIGNDVTVNAYGLSSHLQGKLLVKQEKGTLGLYGAIDLKNGRYASFGQDLVIRKGQVLFNGLPSQPMLNVEAIRNPEAMENSKITAGVKVTGLADSPSVTVFSEPSLSQDQALSYILTGRSLENSGEAGSSGSVGAALLGMGLAKSGKVVGKIGETFGISDLNLGTAGVGDSSKVVVSGNLTKDLQIKYGVGLFNGLAEVTLRYRLWSQLFLQSVSSTNQAVDLLYQFEF